MSSSYDDSSCGSSSSSDEDSVSSAVSRARSQSISTETSNTGHRDLSETEGSEDTLGKSQEVKAMSRSKEIVLALMTIAATAVGAGTYFFIHNQEDSTFRTEVSETCRRRNEASAGLTALLT